MSRTTNAALTETILRAARSLWHERGEKGLTLRGVASAAGTTTPSVYQRFPSREALVDAIAKEIQVELGGQVASSKSIEAGCERYLRMAKRQRREYDLFFGPSFPRLVREGTPRPGFDWAVRELVRRHGGTPNDYEPTVYALVCLLHGCAGLLQHVPPGQLERDIRESCLGACAELAAHPLRPARLQKKERQPVLARPRPSRRARAAGFVDRGSGRA